MCAGLGRLMIGWGAIAVMAAPPGVHEPRRAELRLWRTSAAPGPDALRATLRIPCRSLSSSGTPIVAHRGAEGNPVANETGSSGDPPASARGDPGAHVDRDAVPGVGIGHQPAVLTRLTGAEPAADLAVEAMPGR